MQKVNKSELTKLNIVRVANRKFLETGYTNTTVKMICTELGISAGNLTFYFPTKEAMLATLVDICCDFQWNLMKEETKVGNSLITALCFELVTMAAMCEEDPVAKDFYISAYTNMLPLEIIRRNDAIRAKRIFGEYCKDFSPEDFYTAEVIASGIEYAVLTSSPELPFESRVKKALAAILALYNVPKGIAEESMGNALNCDYKKVGKTVLNDFREYVEAVNEQAFEELTQKV